VDFGVSQLLERFPSNLYARPAFYFSLLAPLLPLLVALQRGRLDEAALLVVFSTASFYGIAAHQKGWKPLGYTAGALYNAFLWIWWARSGWAFAEHPQFYLIPVGFSA